MLKNIVIKIIREPLVIFLLLGGALFGLYQQLSNEDALDSNQFDEIVVSLSNVESLAQGYEAVWRRRPNEEELLALVRSFIREEVYYREAVGMSLDNDDAIIRRRLVQKLEYLMEDLADIIEPDDQELQAFMEANLEDYRRESTFSFQQVYLQTQDAAVAGDLLAQLRSGDIEPDEISESRMMADSFTLETEFGINRVMGGEFLEGLRQLETGSWQGPVRSGFGLHLVNISQRTDGGAPALSEVRPLVLRDWANQHRKETSIAFYAALLERYKVSFDEDLPDEVISVIEQAAVPSGVSEEEMQTIMSRMSDSQ